MHFKRFNENVETTVTMLWSMHIKTDRFEFTNSIDEEVVSWTYCAEKGNFVFRSKIIGNVA